MDHRKDIWKTTMRVLITALFFIMPVLFAGCSDREEPTIHINMPYEPDTPLQIVSHSSWTGITTGIGKQWISWRNKNRIDPWQNVSNASETVQTKKTVIILLEEESPPEKRLVSAIFQRPCPDDTNMIQTFWKEESIADIHFAFLPEKNRTK